MAKVHTVPALPPGVGAAATRDGWLEDWRLPILIIGVALLGVGAWTVVAVRDHRAGRRRRHRLLRRVGLSVLTVLTLLLGVGIAVNAYVGYAPDITSLRESVPALIGARPPGGQPSVPGLPVVGGERGRVTWVWLADRANRIPADRAYVYLPPGYDDSANATRRYPVVYLIHGYPGSSWDWMGAGRAPVTAGLLQNARLAGPLIIVTPEASAGTLRDSECLNSTTNGPQLETFLTSTVVSSVDRMFRTLPDRTSRVIGGMSSGGYCALNLGLRHQSEFGTILGIIPYGDPGRNATASMLGNNDAVARDNSPSRYVPTMPVRYPQAVYLSSGTDHGPFFAATSQLARALAQHGEDVSMRTEPSLGHTWRAARTELPFGLAFAAAHLSWS